MKHTKQALPQLSICTSGCVHLRLGPAMLTMNRDSLAALVRQGQRMLEEAPNREESVFSKLPIEVN